MKKTAMLATACLALGFTPMLSACLDSGADIPQREELIEQESQRLNAWFTARYEDQLARSPMSRTYLGMDDGMNQLDDVSQMAIDEEMALAKTWLDELRRDFDIDRLDDQSRLSYRLFEVDIEDQLATYAASQNDYVFSHMSGPHTGLPSFLINYGKVESVKGAEDYISRLRAVDTYFGQTQARAESQFAAGVTMPKFVYTKVSNAARNVITGAPFHYTTTNLTADEIHDIGLAEVARIQDEMREIMTRVGFEGTLKEFFTFLRTDPQFTFPETDEGRDAYMAEATAIIDDMRLRLDTLFITKPKANMVVKRVEPFREDTAFGAFYNSPALDGSRPGTYYVNLKSMADQPKFLMQALAYHEGIPGHHMQIAIAQELQGLPKFRTLGGHTAFIEGWALVQYYLDNIPNPEGDVRAEIDRYIVWPGQATAYMIGKLKIEDLRAKAEAELGDDFDIRTFHDTVIANGSVPLSILEELVDTYILDTKSETN